MCKTIVKMCVRLCNTRVNEQCEKLVFDVLFVEKLVKTSVKMCETVYKTNVNEQCEKLVKASI